MDELVDILDDLGNPTGSSVLKSEAHKKGLFHPTVHVWCYTKNKELLFQKRAANKKTFPSLWDVSVAGHVAAGETIEKSAQREVLEEIGLNISITDLQKIGVFKSVHHHPNNIIDAEFDHCYLIELKVSVEALTLQKEEVDEVQLFSIPSIKEKLSRSQYLDGFVPISDSYWNVLFDKIKELVY